AVDVERVPALGMTDIDDRDVVVLAPEERDLGEWLPLSEHVARRGLALPLGHHPMLDPQVLSGVGIGPARDIAGREDAGCARLQVCVDGDAAVDLEARALGELDARPHADADYHEVGRQRRAALELDGAGIDRGWGLPEMKHDTVLLMDGAHEIAE